MTVLDLKLWIEFYCKESSNFMCHHCEMNCINKVNLEVYLRSRVVFRSVVLNPGTGEQLQQYYKKTWNFYISDIIFHSFDHCFTFCNIGHLLRLCPSFKAKDGSVKTSSSRNPEVSLTALIT